tara:strand:+ start:268 stop:483 length:216 start_codon:yes stop_codon:yes gene_type:complete
MTETENIPDKQAYQVNRRRMCWAALGMMLTLVIAVLISPEKYATAELAPIFYSLSGLIGIYFGATSWQQKR